MRLLTLIAIPIIGLLVALTTSFIVVGQPSEAEARKAFEELGATACHRPGGIAKPWEEIVARYSAFAGKYASLDEFVVKEVAPEVKSRLGEDVKSWDELFNYMATLTGKTGDPRVNTVKSYLASLLLGGAPTTTTPQTPAQPPATPTPTPTTPAETRGISFALAILIAFIIVAVVAAIAYWLSRG